jgi:hypothetical protein
VRGAQEFDEAVPAIEEDVEQGGRR